MAMPPFASPSDRAAALAFFQGHDAAHRLFHAVVQEVANAGPFQLTATKSRVALTARTCFVWCHEANDNGAIWLGFLLPHQVDSPRLRSGLAGGRWSHHIKVGSQADFDAELLGWLREAYEWDVQGIKDAVVKVPRRTKPRSPRNARKPNGGSAVSAARRRRRTA